MRLSCSLPGWVRCLVFSVLCNPACAVTGGSGIDRNSIDSPWAGVVSIGISGGGTYSGALIDAWHVLTAAHVVYGNRATPGNIVVNLNAGADLSQSIGVDRVFIHPDYTTGNTAADKLFAWHDDVAVLRLSRPAAAGVPVYPLFTGSLRDNRDITLAGYGNGGDGIGSGPALKRIGHNRVDDLRKDDEGGNQFEVLLFDFDGPTKASNVIGPAIAANLTLGEHVEAQFAGGDSGGPIFVNDNGTWKIAGIAAFNAGTELSCDKNAEGKPINCGNTRFGSIGGGMVVAPYVDWIGSRMLTPFLGTSASGPREATGPTP